MDLENNSWMSTCRFFLRVEIRFWPGDWIADLTVSVVKLMTFIHSMWSSQSLSFKPDFELSKRGQKR